MTNVAKVHIIEGRPWMDAVISVLEPRSPYRPWHAADGIEPGDAVIAVLDTDPQSVLAGVGIIGPDGDVDEAMTTIDRFYLNGLLEIGTLNMLAGFNVRPVAGTMYSPRSPDDIVAAIGAYIPSTIEALFGRTSLAAGRVLLKSDARCTACDFQLDLTREDSRDRVHIHTAEASAARPEEAAPIAEGPASDDTDPIAALLRGGPKYPRWFPADWPAVLCDSCHGRMRRDGFTSFVDFRFSLNPRCPSCSAQRSMSTMYGMLAGPVEEPWIAAMGCCVEPWKWLCGSCGHQW